MSVELLQVLGNDGMVVNVARVSYGKKVDKFVEKDIKLLNYLVAHKHTSPFRHPTLQFRIKCPIYVERQLFKHQIGWSANSISGRYVDFSDSYTEIEQFRKQSVSSKQGSAEDLNTTDNYKARMVQEELIMFAKECYAVLLKLGVSKEQARTVLPLSLNTEFIWTGTFLAFIHLCHLRLKPDAQKETRDLVQLMLNEVKTIENNPFEHSLNAFGY